MAALTSVYTAFFFKKKDEMDDWDELFDLPYLICDTRSS